MLDEQDLKVLSEMFEKLDSKIETLDGKIETLDDKIETLDDKIETTRNEIFAYLELKIEPQIRLLADGQKTILETLTPKTETEKLKEENELFRMAITDLARRVAELESKVS